MACAAEPRTKSYRVSRTDLVSVTGGVPAEDILMSA